MPTFTYRGTTEDGETITRTIEAVDRYDVYERARSDGHTVESVSSGSGFTLSSLFNVSRFEAFISRVSDDDLVVFTRNLGSMLRAGLPLSRALSVARRQSTNPRMVSVLTDIEARIQKGGAFHATLAEHPKIFGDLYVAMVHAGEEAGTLAEALTVLATQMERSSTIKKKVRGAMIYPSIVVTVMVIIGILMMIYVMPSITSTFTKLDVDLPLSTRILVAVSDFLNAYTVLVLGGMVAAIGGVILLARTNPGKFVIHFILLKLPVIGGIVKETNSARTSRTLASLFSSGVDVIKALEITEDVIQNVHYKPILREAAVQVEKGAPLSDVFVANEDKYPVFVGEMILVGEETGQIAEMLEELARYYEREVEQKTKDLSTIIEPILMVVIGGTVGFFALSMIAPIYSISDSI